LIDMRGEAVSKDKFASEHREHILPADLLSDEWIKDTHKHVSRAYETVKAIDLRRLHESMPAIQVEMLIGITCIVLVMLGAILVWMLRPPAPLKFQSIPQCRRCEKCANGRHASGHPCSQHPECIDPTPASNRMLKKYK
jgi:hypothetical protein